MKFNIFLTWSLFGCLTKAEILKTWSEGQTGDLTDFSRSFNFKVRTYASFYTYFCK